MAYRVCDLAPACLVSLFTNHCVFITFSNWIANIFSWSPALSYPFAFVMLIILPEVTFCFTTLYFTCGLFQKSVDGILSKKVDIDHCLEWIGSSSLTNSNGITNNDGAIWQALGKSLRCVILFNPEVHFLPFPEKLVKMGIKWTWLVRLIKACSQDLWRNRVTKRHLAI